MPKPTPERFTRTVPVAKLKHDDRWEMVTNHSVLDPYRVKAPNMGLCELCKPKGRGEFVEVIHEVARTPFVTLNIPEGAHGRGEFRFVPRKATRVLNGKRVCFECGGFGSKIDLPTQATNPHKTSDVEAIQAPRPRLRRAAKEPMLFNDDL